jgi:hypothetical protein
LTYRFPDPINDRGGAAVADKCREKAVECNLDLAKQWLRMAENAEELERRFSHLKDTGVTIPIVL